MGLISLVAITGWNIAPALKCVRGMDILFLAVLLSSLLLVSVGSVSTVWSREFNGPRVKAVKVAYWHTDVLLQNGSRVYYDQSKYNCPSYEESMQADITFLFTGSTALFAASLLAVFAVLAPKVRVVSCILAGIASVCLCISWGFSISALHTTFCKDAGEGKRIEDYSGIPFESGGGYTKFDGYLLQEGVVFVIIASVLTLNSVVLNLLFP
ncbi:unnamed protein product [Phytomonas sp. EM1]|nr:unnamed protein product [Phytomonas sp. EM1]|eukprot:CCW62362.1 unnamed protein product [Phytomonas sp. isolate EM1]